MRAWLLCLLSCVGSGGSHPYARRGADGHWYCTECGQMVR